MSDRLPTRLWRVVFDEGYGWPDCVRRERTARNFTTAEGAGRMVAALRRWPTHHRIVAVYTIPLGTWVEVDPDTLPDADAPDLADLAEPAPDPEQEPAR